MEIFILQPLAVGKLGLFSGMENDALMHREGLKGQYVHSRLFEAVSHTDNISQKTELS